MTFYIRGAGCWYTLFFFLFTQIFVSTKFGFTKFERDEYDTLRTQGRLIPDGVGVQYRREHGPLSSWMKSVA